MTEQQHEAPVQATFDGDRATPVECEYYEGCHGQVKWDIEAFMYDGYGWDYENVLACQSCYDEHFELKTRNSDERARRLKPGEMWDNRRRERR